MKTTLIALAGTLAFSAAQAQFLVGWDYSQYSFDNFSSIDGTNLTGTVNANYVAGVPDFVGGASAGVMIYDGTVGTTAFDLNGSEVSPNGALSAGTTASQGTLSQSGSLNTLDFQGQPVTTERGFGLSTDGSFAFQVFGNIAFSELSLAAFNLEDSAATLVIDVSTDGVTYSPVDTLSVNTTVSPLSVDLSGISGEDLYFRGTLSGLDSGLFGLDNVAFSGTVVPEPSSYAAIMGALVIAFVAVRRRR